MTNNDSGENERISQNFLGNGSTVVRQDMRKTFEWNFMEALIEISSHWIRKRAMTSFCAQKVRPIAQIQNKRRMRVFLTLLKKLGLRSCLQPIKLV